ncbi:MAG: NUDIX hydrolase [Chloroflexi bacterium]|nr:NUDIX hydrolase [Chloroflexota bacterium]
MTSGATNEPTIATRSVFSGRIIDVRVDTIRLPNGRETTREIVEHEPSICVVPVDDDGNVLLVRQYRKPTESFLLEVPAGGIEEGEEPEESTRRELQEEIGHTAAELTRLTAFYLAPGWASEYMYAFLATGLTPAELDSDEDEFIDVVPVPWSEIPDRIADGSIQDAKSVASLLLAMRVLGI